MLEPAVKHNPGNVASRFDQIVSVYHRIELDLRKKDLDFHSVKTLLNQTEKFAGSYTSREEQGPVFFDMRIKNHWFNRWQTEPGKKWVISDSLMTYILKLIILKDITQYFITIASMMFEISYYKNLRRRIFAAKKAGEGFYLEKTIGGIKLSSDYRAYRANNIGIEIENYNKLFKALSPVTKEKLNKLLKFGSSVLGVDLYSTAPQKNDSTVVFINHASQFLEDTLISIGHYGYSASVARLNDWPEFMQINVPHNEKFSDLLNKLQIAEGITNDRQSRKRKMTDPDFGEVIYDYGDKRWEYLNMPCSEKEALLGGHCGNVPGALPTDRILSFRVKTKIGKKYYWVPKLTFILKLSALKGSKKIGSKSKIDGMLGEMKGSYNSKPTAAMKPYIMDILIHPYVSGIVGGGYHKENNFNYHSDLNDNDKLRIKEEREKRVLKPLNIKQTERG